MKKEVLVILVFLFLVGCGNDAVINSSFESLNYEMTECIEFEKEDEIIFEGDDITISHIIEISCCYEPLITYKIKDGILRIYEEFEGEECDCLCEKEIKAEITKKDIIEVEFYTRPNIEWPYERILEELR